MVHKPGANGHCYDEREEDEGKTESNINDAGDYLVNDSARVTGYQPERGAYDRAADPWPR